MKLKIIGIVIVILIISFFSFQPTGLFSVENKDTIKIGWISDLSGPVAKYGAFEAGILAVEEINANGGINGKKINLIIEDGKCKSKDATNAIKKLIHIDKVQFILGGHCTPESAAIAPIVEENKIIMLASITTSPVLTPMGEYVFRTSPVSIVQSDLMADLSYNKLGHKDMAIIFEQTDYARPIAIRMQEQFVMQGGSITNFEDYIPGTNDFRTIISKIKINTPDAVMISAQSPDAAFQIVKQIKELGLTAQLFGNDVVSNKGGFIENPELQEGLISAGPIFDRQNSKTKAFIEAYKTKYNEEIPFGFFTAESYDAVYVLKEAIEAVGPNPDKVKDYLYDIDYNGVSGNIKLDENGDGIREYILKIVKDGELIKYNNRGLE